MSDRSAVTSGIWYSADLVGSDSAEGDVALVGREFAEALNAVGSPDGACLIVTEVADEPSSPRDPAASRRRVFFSPRSVSLVPHLIARYGATPCEAPRRSDAQMLVGSAEDWALLRRDSH